MKNVNLIFMGTIALFSILSRGTEAQGAVLFRDDFAGNSGINTEFWRLPQFPDPPPGPGDSNPTFLGRTQLRLDEFPEVRNGVARLRLNTYNPRNSNLQPGEIPSFFGSEIITHDLFSLGNGLAVEASVRVDAPDSLATTTQKGLVAAFFLFDSQEVATNQFLFNEIDFEFLTNDVNNAEAGALSRVLTNVFANDPPGIGDRSLVDIADLDLSEFNTFRIEWLPNEVRWLVNGDLIRTEPGLVEDTRATVPTAPMSLRLNFWGANGDFSEAFDAALQPALSAADDQSFFYEVDFVQVEQLDPPSVPEPLPLAGLIGVAVLGWRRWGGGIELHKT